MSGDAPPPWLFLSAMPGVAWPPVLAPQTAVEISLLFQIEQSQWLPAAEIERRQLAQVELLLRHAAAHVPFYAGRLDAAVAAPLTRDAFKRLPILSRIDVQQHFDALQSNAVPPEHGERHSCRSSGSTGTPVRVMKTALTSVYWNVFSLRDHLWHGRDLGARMCVLRQGRSGEFANWGTATSMIRTGPSSRRDVDFDYDSALRWLVAEQPAYLQTYPSVVEALARDCLAQGVTLPSLREVRTFGEPLEPHVQALCRRAWDVPVTDSYSAEEVGYIALRCASHGRYHCQSEGVLVEVLDDEGRDCAPGERGRVVVTPLHNFAMPLLRYDLGDYAEAGAACECGRGLPVLARILGRVHHTLVAADGKRYWPVFGLRSNPALVSVEQHRVVQRTRTHVEVLYVSAAPLSDALDAVLRTGVKAKLPAGFEVTTSRVDAIARSPSGKFIDFVSEVSA